MANELIKGAIKVTTAIIVMAFGGKVMTEGRKNIKTGIADCNNNSQNNTKK